MTSLGMDCKPTKIRPEFYSCNSTILTILALKILATSAYVCFISEVSSEISQPLVAKLAIREP